MPRVNKPRAGADSEKITINLGFVDLGRTDVLVREGFYASRADFIRTAIRNQLEREESAAQSTATRQDLMLGIHHYTRDQLEAAQTSGQLIDIKVLGLASIAADVTPELALATIRSLKVLGALQASAEVKAALADRTF